MLLEVVLNKFKRKKVLNTSTDLKNALHIIEISTDPGFLEGLGIIEKRGDELTDICEEHYRTSKNVVECMEKVSKHCKHANELYFCCMIITCNQERMLNMKKMQTALDNMFKKKND